MLRTAKLCWRSTSALATCAGPSIEEVRIEFRDFFLQRDHVHLPSSFITLRPTRSAPLMLRFAGGKQFRPVYRGDVAPDHDRVVYWQRCLRISNYDAVGHNLHQHSFFEMLGTLSFNGAYSKREACEHAWVFLTERVKISPERIYVSYFGGSTKLELGPDTETREIWKTIGVPEDRILPFESENFWDMGETGPCGPSTRLHVDRIASRKGAQALVNCGDDSLVEVWNLAFVTHYREMAELLWMLPSTHVYTGMNLERLTSILQNVPSNYDTDAFQPIFAQIEALGGPRYTASSSPTDVSLRKIADYLRGFCVALADGLTPRSSHSFYLHRLMKMAFLHMHRVGLPQGSSGQLVDTAFNLLIPAYPSFRDAYPFVRRVAEIKEKRYTAEMKYKEESHVKPLARSLSSLPDDCQFISGDLAWFFYLVLGVPIEVLQDFARSQGWDIDIQMFEYLRQEHRERSKRRLWWTRLPD